MSCNIKFALPVVHAWRSLSTAVAGGNAAVFVDGVRTPFLQSFTGYKNLYAYELQRNSIVGLMRKLNLNSSAVQYVVCGTVIQEVRTTNIAREASLSAGISNNVPAHTVTMACISSNQAISTCIESIRSGMNDLTVAGGVELMSDVPIRIGRLLRRGLLDFNKAKTLNQKLPIILQLVNPANWKLEFPSITEFTSAETMGHSADRLAASFKISRAEQDEYALRSHTLAEKAIKEGKFTDVIPVIVPGSKKSIDVDNGVRVSSLAKLASLKPVFRPGIGTITAGNSSFLTDGASACLIANESKAKALGLKPKARLREYVFVAQDPKEELLLGPAYAIPKVLDKAKVKLSDIDVFEMHEAFAGQVLAILKALDSDYFAKSHLGRQSKIGQIPLEKLNTWGGSLSIGHPFGATGVRIVTQAVNRLLDGKGGRLALVASCASGGLGHAMLIERYDAN